MTSAGSGTLLLLAGVLAGVVGTAGGITSLVSYPALLAVGVPALPATVANMVSAVVCWPASGLMSRRELAGSGRWLSRGLPVAAAGAAAGAGLLLTAPPGVFARVVPFLVAAASVVLLAQPKLAAPRRRDRPRTGTTLVGVGVLQHGRARSAGVLLGVITRAGTGAASRWAAPSYRASSSPAGK